MNRRLLMALIPLCAGMFAVGCTGPAGMTGAQGSPGLTGAQGSPGMTGAQGSAGMTGAQGSAGMTGVQGSAGMTGVQGPTGITGATGAAAPNLAPLPAVRWTSMKDFMFDFDRSDIRYSESKKPAEIATYMTQNPTARLGIDGYTDSRSST
jgi:outer membrane protein OmpA-like peptidoglycan-associated protein